MDEYIEREAATNVVCNILWKMNDLSTSVMAKALNSIPAADVAPVRHGHWCWDGRFRACSICGSYVEFTETLGASHWKYCPHCGAKMDGGED